MASLLFFYHAAGFRARFWELSTFAIDAQLERNCNLSKSLNDTLLFLGRYREGRNRLPLTCVRDIIHDFFEPIVRQRGVGHGNLLSRVSAAIAALGREFVSYDGHSALIKLQMHYTTYNIKKSIVYIKTS